MTDKTEMKIRLDFHKTRLEKLRKAYLALVDGGVKTYTIDDRSLTRFDLDRLRDEIDEAENKVDELTQMMGGQRQRKVFGVLPRDW